MVDPVSSQRATPWLGPPGCGDVERGSSEADAVAEGIEEGDDDEAPPADGVDSAWHAPTSPTATAIASNVREDLDLVIP
jgi:hypothetical protein